MEDWIGGELLDGMTYEEYLQLMRSSRVGGRMRIGSAWLLDQSTRTTDPTEMRCLGLYDESVRGFFGYTRDEGRLLRVRPLGEAEGEWLEVEVEAVHDLADFYALPGTPVRRLLDFLILGTAVERDPLNDLSARAPFDGRGDPAHRRDGAETEYERQGERARRRSAELGLRDDWRIDCVFPHEMLYAVQARGHWDERWTPDGYQRIAARRAGLRDPAAPRRRGRPVTSRGFAEPSGRSVEPSL